MKLLRLLVACAAVAIVTCGETSVGPEHIIRRIIDSGISEGHDNKIIGGMGDAAAVLVTKVVAGRRLGSTEIDGVLVILNMSFASETGEGVDQEPRTALFVLQLCDSSTQDEALKNRISLTAQYIQRHSKGKS
jgi:hypothetical protein